MDVILTTNSPGEVSAWVKPMVKAIKKEWPESRITVFIPPCTFASGREVPVVESFDEVDQVFGPREYIKYMIFRRKPRGFKPGEEGFVLFLGGDLGHAVMLGKRFKYPVYAYSERDAGFSDRIRLFFVPSLKVAARLERKGVKKEHLRPVGDLMLDAVKPDLSREEMEQLLGLDSKDLVLNIFPGSRPHEVKESFPLFLKAVIYLKNKKKRIKPLITLAPFITLDNIRSFLDEAKDLSWELKLTDVEELVELKVFEHRFLIYRGSSYNTMQVSQLAFALPGTNNVELAAMGVPTLVILPLNWPELIPLPGIIGLIGQIPLLGPFLKRKVVIPKLVQKFLYVSPVNRSLGDEILPELKGVLTPEMIAERTMEVIDSELLTIKDKLKKYKKEEKASERIISEIRADLPSCL
ncbi:hypothetical protein BBF96_11425 [Anoxybacter fermentans]|uniref:Uncharacterized protein n=1 Tax=Anoxybacter fermentans TaxID=1323375 RepID=A0A3Q9HR77_9FIRM|nr:hypothetical protein [Anoxybacter fermentans]AZR73947.1 hypothetical protein BBF96_11425 [Anoxybacter fermentans]